MSILPYILPALTVVTLFLYVFSAERAYLPKMGTTEWIVRASTPKRMTADIKLRFSWKDIVVFLSIVVVYGVLAVLSCFAEITNHIFDIVCTALFVGIVYLFAQLIFKNRVTALFAAAMTAADLLLVNTFDFCVASFAVILFVFFIIISSDNIWAFIPAGIFLSAAVYYNPACILFLLLALCPAAVSSARTKNSKTVLLYAVFCVVLSAVSFCFSPYLYITLFSFDITVFAAQPLYFAAAAVCLIITAIHIFKDKSYTALFIAAGLIVSVVCKLFGLHITPVFTGLVMAYPAGIIINRGRIPHKVFCIIFGAVMLIPLLFNAVYPIISTYII